MLGPDDPFNYKPTIELVFIILFIVFPLIYLCGRLVTYLLWQILRCMKYLLMSLYELYYGDEFEEAQQMEREQRKRRHDVKRKKLRLEKAVMELSKGSKSNGASSVTQNGTNQVEEVDSMEMTNLKFETEGDRKEDEPMHHSPTDDEEEMDDNSKISKGSDPGVDNLKLKHSDTDRLNYEKKLPTDAVINPVSVRKEAESEQSPILSPESEQMETKNFFDDVNGESEPKLFEISHNTGLDSHDYGHENMEVVRALNPEGMNPPNTLELGQQVPPKSSFERFGFNR